MQYWLRSVILVRQFILQRTINSTTDLFLLNRHLFLSGDFLQNISLERLDLKPLNLFLWLRTEDANINIIYSEFLKSKKAEFQKFQETKYHLISENSILIEINEL
jgi:hypothetical protein